MGCDIHAFIERKLWREKDGGWHWSTWASPDLSRNYSLFYVLAGVRYDENRMPPGLGAQQKGLPKDVGDWVWREYGDDYHSASWMDVNELRAAHERYCSMEEASGSSWYQPSPPSVQAVPDGARVKETVNILGMTEWYVETGENVKNSPLAEIVAVVAAMEALNDGDATRTRLVFWFDN